MNNNEIEFTQGDSVLLNLTAVDGQGNLIDLTGVTFSTQVLGINGTTVIFPNSQHTANPDQINFKGQFTLALSVTDTPNCAVAKNKEMVTQITNGASVLSYRGFAILTVLQPTPRQ